MECLDDFDYQFDLYEYEVFSPGASEPKLLYHNGVDSHFYISCGWLYYLNRITNLNDAGVWYPGASGLIYRGNAYYIYVSDGVRSLLRYRPTQETESILSTDEKNISLLGIVDDTIILKEEKYGIQGYSFDGTPTEFSNSDADLFRPIGAAGEWVVLSVQNEMMLMNIHTEESFILQ